MNASPRIVFIVGAARSGTTLLQQMLNAHPRVAIGPETHFVQRFWMRRSRYGNLDDERAWTRLVEDVLAIPELDDGGVDRARLRDVVGSAPRSMQSLLELLLVEFARGRDAFVIGEKTPSHVLHMPLLRKWFPGAAFVHLVRDPRAVVNSRRNVPWSSGSTCGDAMVWRRSMAIAERDAPGDGAMLDVRYEQLVTEPERQLRRVCEFLDLEYDAGMLEHHARPSVGVDPAREPWKGRATGALRPQRVDAWRSELSAPDVRIIEGVAGRLMTRAGYDPISAPFLRAVTGLTCRLRTVAAEILGRLRRRRPSEPTAGMLAGSGGP